MTSRRWNRLAPLLLTLLLPLPLGAGCGSASQANDPQATQESMALAEVGEMYRAHLDEHGRPPARVADLDRYAPGFTIGSLALQNGDVVAYAGATPSAESDAGVVLAYEKQVPESGGGVLTLAGEVRPMTADEFRDAPKAGTGTLAAARGRRR